MESRNYVREYLDWLQKQYSYRQIDEVAEITTPLTNNIGDNLRIYLESIGKNKIRLSDDGTTLEDLELMGIDISTNTREYIINDVLRQYNVSIDEDDNSLYIDGSEIDFPLMKFNLTNAMQKINDLTFTKKATVNNLFFEEVYKFFDDNDFGGIKNPIFMGSSGVNHKINYCISKSMNLIELQNKNISKQSIMIACFIYEDIRKNKDYSNAKFSIVYNAENISESAEKLARSADISLIPWSNRQKLFSLKTA